jgi:hypothetical protein
VRRQCQDVVIRQVLGEWRHHLRLAQALAKQNELIGEKQLRLPGERGHLLHLGVAVLAVAGAAQLQPLLRHLRRMDRTVHSHP